MKKTTNWGSDYHRGKEVLAYSNASLGICMIFSKCNLACAHLVEHQVDDKRNLVLMTLLVDCLWERNCCEWIRARWDNRSAFPCTNLLLKNINVVFIVKCCRVKEKAKYLSEDDEEILVRSASLRVSELASCKRISSYLRSLIWQGFLQYSTSCLIFFPRSKFTHQGGFCPKFGSLLYSHHSRFTSYANTQDSSPTPMTRLPLPNSNSLSCSGPFTIPSESKQVILTRSPIEDSWRDISALHTRRKQPRILHNVVHPLGPKPFSERFEADTMGTIQPFTSPKKLEQLIANPPFTSGIPVNRLPTLEEQQKAHPVTASLKRKQGKENRSSIWASSGICCRPDIDSDITSTRFEAIELNEIICRTLNSVQSHHPYIRSLPLESVAGLRFPMSGK